MKALKVIAAIIISVLLLAGESAVMGMFSVDRAVSEKTINDTIKETEIVDELVDEVLAQSTVNMGGKYGEAVKEAMRTDSMRSFFSAYMTSVLRSSVYGNQYEEIGEDDLTKAFSSAMDEVGDSGKVNLSSTEEELIRQAMMKEIPDLTDDLNKLIAQYDTTNSGLAQDMASSGDVQKLMMGTGIRIIALIISLGLCAALIGLFWRSRAGFIWCAVVTAIVSVIFLALTNIGGESVAGLYSASASEQFVLVLLSHGFKSSAVAGFIAALIFAVVYVILRLTNRNRRREI